MIRTTLMMQSSYIDEQGVKRKAAWNEAAYRYTTEPDSGPEKCWMVSTWDAIFLMRLAARYVDEPLQHQVDESHLVGVIHKTGRRVYEMDPLLAVQKIRRAGVKRFGGSMDLPPPNNWRGNKYLPWKLRMINYPIAHSDDLRPLTIVVGGAATKDIYLAAVEWYGEQSPLGPP